MPGQPAETMIGVGALGLGIVLVFAAVQNVSPLALIKNAVTTGDLDYSKLPKIATPGGGSEGSTGVPANIEAILKKIEAKDSELAGVIRAGFSTTDFKDAEQRRDFMQDVTFAFTRGYINLTDVDQIKKYVDEKGGK